MTPRRVRLTGWTLIFAAVLLLGWAVRPLTPWHDGRADRAKERDVVLRTGRSQIAVLNTIDHTRADADLRRWLAVTTGPLHEQLRRDRATALRKVAQSATTAEGTVPAAAVTALDSPAGKAKVIASVHVRLLPRRGEPSVQRNRFEAGLTRTPGGWKLTSLTAIAPA